MTNERSAGRAGAHCQAAGPEPRVKRPNWL
jgi:hypothetical protein